MIYCISIFYYHNKIYVGNDFIFKIKSNFSNYERRRIIYKTKIIINIIFIIINTKSIEANKNINENKIEYYFKQNIFSSENENINYLRIINNNINGDKINVNNKKNKNNNNFYNNLKIIKIILLLKYN